MGLFSPRWSAAKQPLNVASHRSPLVDPFLTSHAEVLRAAGNERLAFDEKTWNHKLNSAVGLDVEVYRNFLVICFKRFEDGKRLAFEMSDRCPLNVKAIDYLLRKNLIISFNGNAYDLPIIALAVSSADCRKLKEVSNRIIKHDLKPWEVVKELNIALPRVNHIDLIETNPSVRQGLKMLHGRLHGRFMVDLPYHENAYLTPREMNVTTLYCHNDLDATQLVFEALREPLELRAAFSKEYGIDLRSKSDSQIGELIVKRRVENALGRRLTPTVPSMTFFNYTPPDFLTFEDSRLSQLLEDLRTTTFSINGAGKIDTPPLLAGLEISLGRSKYAMGIGGLHSKEAHRSLRSDDNNILIDVDVASQYPNIITRLGLYPEALGPAFLEIYSLLIRTRLAAKAAGDKVRADGGRIALNGVYGKLGSAYSCLYAPHLLIATTLTGQLSILMLIERAEAAGIPVVSANTDGVVFNCPRIKEGALDALIAAWESDTGLFIEKTRYRALYNSSVNTYIALKEDGKAKRKGIIADPWKEGDLRGQMMKNPQMTICSEAILRFLLDETPIEKTIRTCTDPRAFVTVVRVTGGAQWRGVPIGRAVRYYYSLDSDPIFYATRNARVSKTEGAKPLLELTDRLPEDIDYLRYCEETVKLAHDLAVPLT